MAAEKRDEPPRLKAKVALLLVGLATLKYPFSIQGSTSTAPPAHTRTASHATRCASLPTALR